MHKTDVPILSFKSQRDWANWLAKQHAASNGIWLRFFKKDSGVASVTYAEALDEALCYGWIDGRLDPYDEKSWLRRFTPRRPRSPWSKRNIEHVNRLTAAGRMKPAGLQEAEAAKKDGRWDKAYDPQGAMEMPADFLQALAKDKKAKAFFESLSRANHYAIAWRLQTAKRPETRARRMQAILAMLKKGEKFHG